MQRYLRIFCLAFSEWTLQVGAAWSPRSGLLFIDGVKASEVAEQLSVSAASVYQSKSRVLRRLRERLDELPQ